jgi:hypothetical protein
MRSAVTILLILGLFTACKKSNTEPHAPVEVAGALKYGGDPYADGLGYYLSVDSTHELLSLQNLPAEYKRTDIDVHVAIRFYDTGETMSIYALPGTIGPRIVVLRSIRKL